VIRYSVVIPTKARADTLQHVVRNVLSSPREDIEVIVHQCGSDPATDAVIAAAADRRLRYHSSPDVVPMRENWERALSHATGDFVTVIGDDDAVIPGAFEIADDLIGRHALSILSWRPVTYYWPGYFDERLAGRAIYRYDIGAGNVRFASKYALRCLYRFRWHYSDMPMIYNSFVSRRLIDSIRSKQGRYFLLNSPDITSGAINALHCDDFVWSNYPLTITGISGKSTGHRMAMHGSSRTRDEAISEFMPERLAQDWIPCVSNLDFSIAAELLTLRETLGIKDPGQSMAMEDIADYVARQLHKYPQVEESREALRLFCVRHGIDFDGITARYLLARLPTAGLPVEASTPDECVMNRNLAELGDADICAAALSIAAYLGPPRAVPTAAVGFESQMLRLSLEPLELRFSRTGNAPQYLRDGWNPSEAFGTWSSRYEATIALPALGFPGNDGRLRLEVAGRGPIASADIRFFFSVSIAGTRFSRSGEFSALRISGTEVLEIDIADLPSGAPLKLIVRCVELVNTALLGRGVDDRPLGFGLETLTFTFIPASAAPEQPAT
jgi:Glycosyl transferase family 2